MPHTLITFLGKGRDNPDSGYRRAVYRFEDGSQIETPYFGLALTQHIRPDRLIVLGTASSMWDIFVEQHARERDGDETLLELMDRVAAGTVDEDMLARVAPMLSKAIGLEVQPHLIGMARSLEEQGNTLEVIAKHTGDGRVSIDVTHGFRHLGMLGFLSGILLERIKGRNVRIDGLWYGALDMIENGVAPVLRLDGLQDIQRWIDALNRFEASGNYGVFAPLLEKDGLPPGPAGCLAEAAFCESVMNIGLARTRLRTALNALQQPLPGASRLFQERLVKLLAWANNERLSDCQAALARRALSRDDFQGAALLGLEGLITRCCEQDGENPLEYNAREAARSRLREQMQEEGQGQAYRDLNALRNAMAHGTQAQRRFRTSDGRWHEGVNVIRNRDLLRRVLQDCIGRLH